MVPGNARRGRPQGQCHRKQTAHLRARALRRVRVKRCGKSAPRSWQQERQGKPHQEQRQIGVADGLFPARHPGRRREASGNGRPRGMIIQFREEWTEPGLQALWLNSFEPLARPGEFGLPRPYLGGACSRCATSGKSFFISPNMRRSAFKTVCLPRVNQTDSKSLKFHGKALTPMTPHDIP